MRARLVTAALLALPVVELFVLVQVGQWLGAPTTLAIVLASSVLGVLVVRWAGRAALTDLAALGARRAGRSGQVADVTVDESGRVVGRDPAAPSGTGIADRALTGLAGALLIVPGLIGTAVGLALLVPGVRSMARALMARTARRPLADGGAGVRIVSVGPPAPTDPAGPPDPRTERPQTTEPRALEDGTGTDGFSDGFGVRRSDDR